MEITEPSIMSLFLTIIPSHTFTIFLLPFTVLLYFLKLTSSKLTPDDTHKTAITTHFVLSEFTHVSFGLKNATQTFQRFIDQVLQGLHFTYAYIDDVHTASHSPEEHLQQLRADKYWSRQI